jgi:hypothetical protein
MMKSIRIIRGKLRAFRLTAKAAAAPLVPIVLVMLLSACGSFSGADSKGHILVVDARGAPIQGALVLAEDESQSGSPHHYTDSEIYDRATDAQGNLRVDLDDYYWASDGCYHFHVMKRGYEDETMSVSKDLFPALLKVDMRPREPDTNPKPPRS